MFLTGNRDKNSLLNCMIFNAVVSFSFFQITAGSYLPLIMTSFAKKTMFRKAFALVFITTLSFSVYADDWGQKGHRTTAAIASTYLTGKAKKAIKELLDDETLVTISTYADEIKSYDEYRKYSSWHYVNVEPGLTYEESDKNDYGDLVSAIRTCEEVLTSDRSSKEEKVFHLKLLVHFIGDLHQPLHLGRAEDKGGNDFQVRWFNDGTNLHSVWDTKMIESYGMSYSELNTNFGAISKKKFKELTSGELMSWVQEGQQLAQQVYNSADQGEKLGYRYVADHMDLVTLQLQKGGVRLAKMLNSIFG